MEVYKTREGHSVSSDAALPTKDGDYLYLLQIGEPAGGRKMIKIGTTNNVRRRMGQLAREYKTDIKVIWVSNKYTKYTTLRVEDKMRNIWRQVDNFSYIPNDRFWIPEDCTSLTIEVRTQYKINL